jgi:outer membrane protein
MKKISFLITATLLSGVISAQQTLSLKQCQSLAIEHNQKMKVARGQVDAAEALKKSAFTQYLPNFSINGGYTYQNREIQLLNKDIFLPVVPYTAIDATTGGLSQAALSTPSVAASTFVINPSTGTVVTDPSGNPVFQKYSYLPASKTKIDLRNVYVANGGFTQPVYMGGKIRETNKIARYVKEVADYNLSLTGNELMYSVEEAYWRIVSLKGKVKLAVEYQDMLKMLVSDLENIHSEGIITNNDLLKAKLKLSEAEIQLLKAKNGMELSKMALCQMTGVTYSQNIVLTDSLNTYDSTVTQYTASADQIAGRPELKILEKNVDIARSGVKLMESRYHPNIIMNAGYTVMNPNIYNGLTKDFGGDYTIGVICNIPLFHFGDKKHTLSAAKAEQTAATQKLDESRELMVLQLQQAVYKYTESVKTTEYAAQALDQSVQNLRYTEDNFREGILKTTDLLEAQMLWQKAYSELIDARTDQQLSVSNIKKITGKY